MPNLEEQKALRDKQLKDWMAPQKATMSKPPKSQSFREAPDHKFDWGKVDTRTPDR